MSSKRRLAPGERVNLDQLARIAEEDIAQYVDLCRILPTLTEYERSILGMLFEWKWTVEEVSVALHEPARAVYIARNRLAEKLRGAV